MDEFDHPTDHSELDRALDAALSGGVEPSSAQLLTNALLELADMARQIRETTLGYRAQLEAAGIDGALADQMTAQYHGFLLQVLVLGAAKGGDS